MTNTVKAERAKRKTVVLSAQGWFDAARDDSYSMGEKLCSMENAFNHTENALVAARQQIQTLSADCAAYRRKLESHGYKFIRKEHGGAVQDMWECKYCWNRCVDNGDTIPNTQDIQHKHSCVLSTTSGQDLLAKIEKAEELARSWAITANHTKQHLQESDAKIATLEKQVEDMTNDILAVHKDFEQNSVGQGTVNLHLIKAKIDSGAYRQGDK